MMTDADMCVHILVTPLYCVNLAIPSQTGSKYRKQIKSTKGQTIDN